METAFSRMKLDEKIVIIINGKGGAGKDTVCDIAAKFFSTNTISAITPIKEIASNYGWKGEKDSRARKFLSDLKRAFIEYNDLPNLYLEEECRKFEQDDHDVLFVHIREKDQIDDFKRRVSIKCVTLLVRSAKIDDSHIEYGNDSDDRVEDYPYDYCYANSKPIETLVPDFLDFLYQLFVKEGVMTNEFAGSLPWHSR